MKISSTAVWILSIIVIAALAVAGYFATKINPEEYVPSSGEEQTVSLYFLDNTKTTLVKEQRKTSLAPHEEGLAQLVNMLIEGPKNTVDLKRAIPAETQLLSLDVQGNLVTVNFSKEYYGASSADDMLAAFTIVNTLCDVDPDYRVTILVEGSELIGKNKKPLGAFGKDEIVYEGSRTQKDSVVLSLYFPNSDIQYLQLEKRTVPLKDKEPLAKLALIELMKGSEDKQTQQLIPAEAKLLSVETKNQTCFVNFSKEFVDKHIAGSSAEIMTIYSIVNTLTEIDGIEEVQFLIEGQKVETFGSLVFNEPFKRDTSLLKSSSETPSKANDILKTQTTAKP